jgi:integrase
MSFIFRKRTPLILVDIVGKKELYKTYETEENIIAISNNISHAIATIKSSLPDETKRMIASELLKDFIKTSPTNDHEEDLSILDYNGAIRAYLKSSKNVTALEYNNRKYFFEELLPSIFQHLLGITNPLIELITSTLLHQAGEIISILPNKNISQYRNMEIETLVAQIASKQLKPSEDELLSTSTANKLIKRIRALGYFGASTGLFNLSTNTATVKVKSKGQREERDHLAHEEIIRLLSKADSRTKLLIQLTRYSGMRLSELNKCTIKTIDGILCFDLKSSAQPLKTQSSYRVIPVHSALFPLMDEYIDLIEQKSDLKHLARRVKRLIDSTLTTTDKKSLYSLRHSFATELIQHGADSAIVSELLGHSHSTMTLQRYAKGFSIQRLQEVIELLK